jgi:hypothetical protein
MTEISLAKELSLRKPEFHRIFEMPSKDTFSMPKLRKWVLKHLEGRVLNVFAGETKLREYAGKIVYNDINPELRVDYHYDAREISQFFAPESFDSILLDPPYSYFQAINTYHCKRMLDVSRVISEADKLLKSGGVAITLGRNSTGFGKKRGYQKKAILLVNSGACHNDIIVVVEQKVQCKLLKFPEQTEAPPK